MAWVKRKTLPDNYRRHHGPLRQPPPMTFRRWVDYWLGGDRWKRAMHQIVMAIMWVNVALLILLGLKGLFWPLPWR